MYVSTKKLSKVSLNKNSCLFFNIQHENNPTCFHLAHKELPTNICEYHKTCILDIHLEMLSNPWCSHTCARQKSSALYWWHLHMSIPTYPLTYMLHTYGWQYNILQQIHKLQISWNCLEPPRQCLFLYFHVSWCFVKLWNWSLFVQMATKIYYFENKCTKVWIQQATTSKPLLSCWKCLQILIAQCPHFAFWTHIWQT